VVESQLKPLKHLVGSSIIHLQWKGDIFIANDAVDTNCVTFVSIITRWEI